MKGKTVVISGATSGIGAVAALALAREGARIVFLARNQAKGDALLARLATANREAEHRCHLADLSRLAELKRVGAELARTEPQVDVLVNNAGAIFWSDQMTEDGLEVTFATNHMGYFIPTHALLPALRAARGRIVSTSSVAHAHAPGEGDANRLRGYQAYAYSKLANILFTRSLASRLAGSGVTATCHHPGFVASGFGDNAGFWARTAMALAKRTIAVTPERGAATLIWLAGSADAAGHSGGYYVKGREVQPTAAALDTGRAARLWTLSQRLAGIEAG